MAKLSIMERARAAMHLFRHANELVGPKAENDVKKYGTDGLDLSQKALPFAWPDWQAEQPQWHLVDIASYIREGFNMNSLVYSSIMYKVRAMTMAPLRVYLGDEFSNELAPDKDPLVERIKRPNNRSSWVEFHSRNVVFFNIAGNVYIYIDPRTGEMHSLRPDRVYIVPTPANVIPADLMGYLYVPEGKSPYSPEDCIPILPDDMLHIKMPNPGDPLEGLGYGIPPLMPAARVADVDNMVTNFLNLFFKRGAMLMGVIKYDIPIDESTADEVIKRWMEKYGGYQNWTVGVLDRGASYERMSLTFEEMGFTDIDSRSETRILGPFGVAPILVHAKVGLERSTYSNYEAARQAFWEDTQVPETTWFQVEYQSRFNDGEKFVRFDYSQVPALQRALPRQVAVAYDLWQMGVPANDALRTAGLHIGDIPKGDEPFGGREQGGGAGAFGRGSGQGTRANPDEDSWGMREDAPE